MNICVYGASGDNLDKVYFEQAAELGRLVAQSGHRLIFGGGSGGLMGACARGAAAHGGEITGIAPRFFDEPGILFAGCTDFIFTDTMAERKGLMEDMADAFIILPGGIGTFEEFFETLTLKQLGRHSKPMAILNMLHYYDALFSLLKNAADGGFLSTSCLKLFKMCDSPVQALEHSMLTEECLGSIKRLQDYNRD